MVPSRAFIVTRLYAFPVFERAGSRAALQRRRRRTNTAPRRPAGSVQKRRCRSAGLRALRARLRAGSRRGQSRLHKSNKTSLKLRGLPVAQRL